MAETDEEKRKRVAVELGCARTPSRIAPAAKPGTPDIKNFPGVRPTGMAIEQIAQAKSFPEALGKVAQAPGSIAMGTAYDLKEGLSPTIQAATGAGKEFMQSATTHGQPPTGMIQPESVGELGRTSSNRVTMADLQNVDRQALSDSVTGQDTKDYRAGMTQQPGMVPPNNIQFEGTGADQAKFQQGMEHSAANAGASRLVPNGVMGQSYSPDYSSGSQGIAPPRTIGDLQRYNRETRERDKQFGMVQQELGRQDKQQQFGMEQAQVAEQTAYDRDKAADETKYRREQDKIATEAASKMTPVQVTSGVAKAQDNYRAMLESPDMPQNPVEGGKKGETEPLSFSDMLYRTDPGLWKASRPPVSKTATDRFNKIPDAEKGKAADDFYMMFGERPEGY